MAAKLSGNKRPYLILRHIFVGKSSICLLIDGFQAIIIPSHAFKSEDHKSEIIEFLKAKMAAHNKH